MAIGPLAKKLQMKPGQRAAVVNAPPGYFDRLGELPEGVELAERPRDGGKFDFVQLFVRTAEELRRLAPAVLASAKPDALIWMSYPKRTSGVETDLTRDEGWAPVYEAGLRAVAQVSIDEVWSAVRFRPAESSTTEGVVEAQYSGKKAHLRPIYDRLMEAVRSLGPDVEVAPRKTYVALIRGRQFAVIQPSTSTRVDLGLKLKGRATGGRLEAAEGVGSGAITHKVALASTDGVEAEVIGWLREAYEGMCARG